VNNMEKETKEYNELLRDNIKDTLESYLDTDLLDERDWKNLIEDIVSIVFENEE